MCSTSTLVSVLECFSCLVFPCSLLNRELVRLVLLVALKCNAGICILQCFDAFHGNCCDWYDWFYRSYLDLILIYVVCGYLVLYSRTVMADRTNLAGRTGV